MENKSLFWYGLKAKIREVIGGTMFFLSCPIIFFNAIMKNYFYVFFFGAIAVYGIYLILTAKASRFDYQRQSGHIIHRGD